VSGTDWLEVIGTLLLVSAVAFLSAAEVTITRTGRARAYRLAEEDRPGAKSLEKIVENVPPHLNVVLLLTLVCTIGGTTLATMFVARHVDR
jgi:CBS domain containing-hemolysin-like protein